MHPLALVLFLSCTGERVSKLEWFGICLSLLGIGISSFHGILEIFSGGTGHGESRALFGDSLCLFVGLVEAAIIVNRHRVKKFVPVLAFTFYTTTIATFCAAIFFMIFEGHLDLQLVACLRETCLLGWASPQWYILMLIFGLVVGLVYMAGFNYAVSHQLPSSSSLL